MNDTFLKFLHFIRANFWDWQFYVFVVFAVLIFGFYCLDRKTSVVSRFFLRPDSSKIAGSDVRNRIYIAVAGGLVCLLTVLIVGIPVPQTHDEFGYLLAADTFLHGRIANPTPFSPKHFEYFHILVQPVYAAKFPPLPGFLLAVGKALTGLPIAGVWLGSVLSGLTIYWLLRVFFSPRRSLFGALFWIFAPLNLIWCNSYWGAHGAVIGGALSAGAFFRFIKDGYKKNLIVWGAGIFLLLNSRLYEGVVLTGLLVLWWIFEVLKHKKFGRQTYQSFGVFLLVIFINLAWIGFYNYSVTQNPLILPYTLHHSQYHQVPLFIFQTPDLPKPGVPPVIRKLDERWVSEFQADYQITQTALSSIAEKVPIYLVWLTRSPFLLILFLLGLFSLAKNAEGFPGRQILLILLGFLAALLLTTFKGDRFLAPAVGVAFVSITFGAKNLGRLKGFWKPLAWSLPFITGGGFLLGILVLEQKRIPLPVSENNLLSRDQIVERLNAHGGNHLIFAETTEANPADARFYIYNEAEISDATIIWAHNLSRSENQALLDFYRNRRVWRLKNVDNRVVLEEYEFENK
jgi:hypothetical protein